MNDIHDSTGWFDAHVLLGVHPERPGRRIDDAAVLEHLARHRLSGALIGSMTSWLHDPLTGNAEVSAAVARMNASRPDVGLRACWTAVPPTPGELDDVARLVDDAEQSGVAAFRIHPATHGFDAGDPALQPFYRRLTELGLPLCVDRTEIGWPVIDAIATRHPELTMIVSLVGYRELRTLATHLSRHPRLAVDLVNFATHQGLEWLVEHFDPSRALFATGLGLRDPGESLTRLRFSDLDQGVVDRIGSGNADRLFGRDRTEERP